MAIISNSYFVKDIVLPNTDETKAEGQYYIAQTALHEPQYLSDILGYKMAKDFQAAIASNPTSGVWYDLWKGAEFTDSRGLLNKWEGFANTALKSPIAYYVFYQILVNIQTQTSGVGVISLSPENANPASMTRKLATAWNEMVRLNWILHEFIDANETDYPDYIGLTYGPVKYSGGGMYKPEPNQKLFDLKTHIL